MPCAFGDVLSAKRRGMQGQGARFGGNSYKPFDLAVLLSLMIWFAVTCFFEFEGGPIYR